MTFAQDYKASAPETVLSQIFKNNILTNNTDCPLRCDGIEKGLSLKLEGLDGNPGCQLLAV